MKFDKGFRKREQDKETPRFPLSVKHAKIELLVNAIHLSQKF